MAGVGHFHDYRVHHGQVQAGGHPVVQEAGVHHLAAVVEEVLFVERPADPLDRAALHLTFHIAGMDGFASILHRGVAQYIHLARLRVYFHVNDVGRIGVTYARWVHTGAPDDGASRRHGGL